MKLSPTEIKNIVEKIRSKVGANGFSYEGTCFWPWQSHCGKRLVKIKTYECDLMCSSHTTSYPKALILVCQCPSCNFWMVDNWYG